MLVLSRKEGETILVGDNIEITVIAIRGDRVQLGISAQRKIPILRSELAQRSNSRNRDPVHHVKAWLPDQEVLQDSENRDDL